MRRLIAIALFAAVPLVAGCEGIPNVGPTSQEETEPEVEQGGAARYGGLEEWVERDFEKLAGATLADVRLAAKVFVQEHLPWWNVKGLAATGITASMYLVGIDIDANGQRQTLNLIVRLFVDDDGNSYWRAETLTAELGQILAGGYALQRQRRVQTDPLAPQ